jgi:S-DNA-T family DNA segregation ATPase FtsK/SpoIIIE
MATTRTPAPRKRKPAPKSKTTTSASSAAARAKRKKPPARGGGRTRARAKRSSATWAPRIPVIEQRHLDLFGLALVACGVFLAFPLYLGWDGGQAGDAVVDGLALAVGTLRYVTPLGVIAAGAVIVMRPVLPSVRPFKSGAICFILALALMFAAGTLGFGPGTIRDGFWDQDFLRDRGGYLGEALFYASSNLIGSIGTHILGLFLLLAGILLLTGASLAGMLKATGGTVAESTRALREATVRPDTPTSRATKAATAAGAVKDPSSRRPRVQVPDSDDDMIVKATHVEAPSLDGVERYPDLFEAEMPEGGAPGEQPRIRRRAKKAADPADEVAERTEIPDVIEDAPQSAAEDANDAAVSDAVMATDELPELQQDIDVLDDGGSRQLELLAARGDAEGEGDEHEIDYIIPDPRVLKRSTGDQIRPDTSGNEKIAASLIEALSHFNVEAKVVGTVSGPHITRYELRLAPGVKMSKVAQLKDDLAYALAATEIRILAPIPGKQAVGIEVPNRDRRIVHLGDVFRARPEGYSPLTVWLGKDVSGKAIGADLAKMPHILVAGTTGAGKSACVNAMLSSILLNATPDEARLVLVDPKQVELNHYEDVPHLLTPVITSPRQAANALQNLVREMEWRYGIMAMKRTRSLNELNRVREEEGDKRLPYILCVIDELADLMMVAPGDVEDSIIRIAQKARAVGIHLVLATQSPRVDVITGMIKANVPSRIAFAVSSQTDSRVILDQNGAESLLGMGDMLFSPVGSSKLQRIQGAYIDEAQVAQITGFWARQGEPELRADLLEEVAAEVSEGGRDEADGKDPDEDPLLADAIELVVEMGTASTSMLQRRMRLGYTRAGRMMDMLERRNIISGYEGSKPRQVLITASDLPRVLVALVEKNPPARDIAGPEASAAPAGTAAPVLPPLPEVPDGDDTLRAAGDQPE